MFRLVSILELAKPCLTRKNGEKAYAQLKDYIANESVDVNLQSVDVISMSFLDGLISKLVQSSNLTRVTFVTNTPSLIEKLSRIAEIREIDFYYRPDVNAEKQLVPKLASVRHQPTLEDSKRSMIN